MGWVRASALICMVAWGVLQQGAAQASEPAHVPAMGSPAITSPLHSASPTPSRTDVYFEPNVGQTDPRVHFIAHAGQMTLFLTDSGAVLSLARIHGSQPRHPRSRMSKMPRITQTAVSLDPVHASARPHFQAIDRRPGTINYLVGNNPRLWRTNVPTYARVVERGVYPGVDLAWYAKPSGLEYDWLVHPGANTRQIALRLTGSSHFHLNRAGSLVAPDGRGAILQGKPEAYQLVGGHRVGVAARYLLGRDGSIRLSVGRYDRARALVIDPSIAYSTFLGGSYLDGTTALTIDGSGDVYVTGLALSDDFPTLNPEQLNAAGYGDAFITKYNASGQMVYSTYLGGTDTDEGFGIAVDQSGNAYVAGQTASTDFPTHSPVQPLQGGGATNGFVTKLSASGASLIYSTYLGGSIADGAYAIAVDSLDEAYITGWTESTDFPLHDAFQPALTPGDQAAFVTKLTGAGNAFIFSTYLGGSAPPCGCGDSGNGIATDSSGNAYVTGYTYSSTFPTKNPIQAAIGGNSDAFITEMNPTGSQLIYSTYVGGSDDDSAYGIAVDSSGNASVTGDTYSTDFPTINPYQADLTGTENAFVTKVNPAGTGYVFSTYLGGTGDCGCSGDVGNAIATDASGNVYVAGMTASTDFPLVDPVEPEFGGSYAAFVSEFNTSGSQLLFSTFLAGSAAEGAYGIADDSTGNIYVTGVTFSPDFPTINAAQPDMNGFQNGFVTKISPITPSISLSVDHTLITTGGTVTFTATATVSPYPYTIFIVDKTDDTILNSCQGPATCTATDTSASPATRSYEAVIAWGPSTYVQSTSSSVSVTWATSSATVSLSTSASTVALGQSVTLTATASSNPAPFSILIIDQTDSKVLKTCEDTTTCTTTDSSTSAATRTYIAEIAAADGSSVQSQSAPRSVSWVTSGVTVSLSSSATTLAFGQSVTLTATASSNPAPYSILIVDQTDSKVLNTCSNTTTCTATDSATSAVTRSYVAEIALPGPTYIQATSAPRGVSWVGSSSTVSLTPSASTVAFGQSVTLTATSSSDPTPYSILIVDRTTSTILKACSATTTCSTTVAFTTATSHSYIARIALPDGTYPQAQSTSHTVSWVGSSATISLSSSASTLALGQPATLTATTSANPSPYSILIIDQTANTTIATCSNTTTCTATVSYPNATSHTYIAEIARPDGSYVQAQSSPQTVSWVAGSSAISLATSATTLGFGQSATLTATASTNPTPYSILIVDQTGNQVLATCSATTTCIANVSFTTPTTRTYVAEIALPGQVAVQAVSSPQTVHWVASSATVSLSTSATTLALSQSATLTATASANPSPYSILIVDQTTSTIIATCGNTTTCTATVSYSTATTHTYLAEIALPNGNYVQSQSAPQTVSWVVSTATISLAVSSSSPPLTQPVTLTATTSANTSPYSILIIDQTDHKILATCPAATTCSAADVSDTAVTRTYIAEIALPDGSEVQRQSASRSVSWAGSGAPITGLITLSASATSVPVGAAITLTAQDFGPYPGQVLQIVDETGRVLARCNATTCYASDTSNTPTTRIYRAQVLRADGSVLAQSEAVTVTWR